MPKVDPPEAAQPEITLLEVILYAAGIAAGFVYTAWQFGG